ncbi:DUF2017 domain-containing protein [Segeticoccus rhizosphaerae]|uniref:DUF2017 domain-containing protein n=1 Tax=Segeticoccus rhizosphaerae TaxID=1104777 RepID=UPI0010C104ED|nr:MULTISPECIES: DUF2017 domain-containing protein [Intrasporangiaceae]
MARAFQRKGDHFVAKLDEAELQVVCALLTQTRDLIAPPEQASTGDPFDDLVASLGPVTPDDASSLDTPRDPALERLVPRANREDDEIADEFRRLTERGLRSRKAGNLQEAIDALLAADPPKVSLDQGQAQAVAMALTDVRLVLGERLGLRTDEDAEALQEKLALAEQEDEDDPVLLLSAYYDFLTWLQESVTLALMS